MAGFEALKKQDNARACDNGQPSIPLIRSRKKFGHTERSG